MENDDKAKKLGKLISNLETYPVEMESNKQSDPQIISLKTALSTIFSELSSPVLIDFGCGKGTLIPFLIEMPEFVQKKGVYIGINRPEIGNELSLRFVQSGFHRMQGSDLITFDTFMETEIIPCDIIVIKNTIHEIQSIDELGKIIYRLLNILKKNGKLIIQDMEGLKDVELGNCPYRANDLVDVLSSNGMECVYPKYESHSGVKLYTIIGKKTMDPSFPQVISESLLSVRENHLNDLKSEMYRQMKEGKADNGFECVSQSFEMISLQKQISEYKSESVPYSEYEKFKYSLSMYEYKVNDILSKKTKNLQDTTWFHNRGNAFDFFTENFQNSSKSVMFLYGVRTIGKTTFTFQALKTRNPNRIPIYVKLPKNCDYWKFIENIFFDLNINVMSDQLANVNKSDVTDIVINFISKFSEQIILCFDDFENILENRQIVDKHLEELISKLSKIINLKILLISSVLLSNIDEVFKNSFCEYKLGLLPMDFHVEEILDAFNTRRTLGIEKYPQELIFAIGRNPSLAYLVGSNIKRYGSVQLVLSNKLESIKKNVTSSILDGLDVSDSETLILCKMSLLIGSEDINEIFKIVNDTQSFGSLVEKGLIYFINTNYFILDTIREYFKNIASQRSDYRDILLEILEMYSLKYKSSAGFIKLSYYRKMTNFKLFMKNINIDIDLNNEYYSSEISEYAEILFELGEYEEALTIFENLRSTKSSFVRYKMRVASCMVRLNKAEGITYYEELINEYDTDALKSSYIGSLLFVNEYDKAYAKMKLYFGLDVESYNPFQIGQRARIEESLGNYREAEDLYYKYIEHRFNSNNILLLTSMYLKIGEDGKALKVIKNYEDFFKNDLLLKTEKGKILERLGKHWDAKAILEEVFESNKLNAHSLHFLVKVLLNFAKDDPIYLREAKELVEKNDNAKPRDQYIHAKILVLLEEKDFTRAEKLLHSNFPESRFKNNIHINSLKAILYNKKALYIKENNFANFNNVFRKALRYTDIGYNFNNIPLLKQRLEIASQLNDQVIIDETNRKILFITKNAKDLH